MSVFFWVVGLSIVLACLAGCASKSKIDWDSRIGTYTYDQAVTELGPPERSTTLSDGRKVAEWERDRDRSHMSFGIGTGFYSRGSSLGLGTTVHPGYYRTDVLRLTFTPEGVLRDWVAERR